MQKQNLQQPKKLPSHVKINNTCFVSFCRQAADFTGFYSHFFYLGDDSDDEDDEEEFITPASSPMAGGTPPITSPAAPSATATKSPETSHDQSGPANKSDLEIALSRKLYERFTISLSDMQVILGRVKDNWRHAHVKGNSSLHLLDKFSIALHCERRVMATKGLYV